jgi:hypothetical protein
MSHLHLPAEHSISDLALAGEVAGALESQDLYVVWTHDGERYARPEVSAVLREPASPAMVEVFTTVIRSVLDVWRALTGPKLPPAGASNPERTPA